MGASPMQQRWLGPPPAATCCADSRRQSGHTSAADENGNEGGCVPVHHVAARWERPGMPKVAGAC